MRRAGEQDRTEDALLGESSPGKLPAELKDLHARQEKLKQAMSRLEQLERERAGRKDLSPKGPAVPLTDPEARVLPNKAGGYAPNYTTVLAVDSASGLIVDSQVLGSNDESSTVLEAVRHIEQDLGSRPQQVAADCGFNTGRNLSQLEAEQVEPLMPARQRFAENPALRADPTQPVAPEQRDKLPVNPQHKILDKAAFVYDQDQDRYMCPMGQPLECSQAKPCNRDSAKGTYRVYQCAACGDCPLGHKCLPKGADRRRVGRDEHEGCRERMARRMDSEQGRAQYKRRAHAAETPFAVFKTVMNFRQFLLRGLKKVNLEQRWTAVAYNLMKLVRLQAAGLGQAVGTGGGCVCGVR